MGNRHACFIYHYKFPGDSCIAFTERSAEIYHHFGKSKNVRSWCFLIAFLAGCLRYVHNFLMKLKPATLLRLGCNDDVFPLFIMSTTVWFCFTELVYSVHQLRAIRIIFFKLKLTGG